MNKHPFILFFAFLFTCAGATAQFSFNCTNGAEDKVSCSQPANYSAQFDNDGEVVIVDYYAEIKENMVTSYMVTKEKDGTIVQVDAYTFDKTTIANTEVQTDPNTSANEYFLYVTLKTDNPAFKTTYVSAGTDYDEFTEAWIYFGSKEAALAFQSLLN